MTPTPADQRCPLTDRLMAAAGLDVELQASAKGRRMYADAYGRTKKGVAKMIAMGGDPQTAEVTTDETGMRQYRMAVVEGNGG